MPIQDHPTAQVTPVHSLVAIAPEWVVAINRNARSQSIGIGGRNQPVRAVSVSRMARGIDLSLKLSA